MPISLPALIGFSFVLSENAEIHEHNSWLFYDMLEVLINHLLHHLPTTSVFLRALS